MNAIRRVESTVVPRLQTGKGANYDECLNADANLVRN